LDWNCAVTVDSSAAALYEVWAGELQSAVSLLAVPEAARKSVGTLTLHATVRQLLHPSPGVFSGDANTARDKVLVDTLRDAQSKLEAQQGTDMTKWSWGKLHTVRFQHPLDKVSSDESVFDRGPVPRPGDGYTVNATAFYGSFAQVAGASYREILDLSDWDNSVGVNVPGQSGQPASPHYDDLIALWSTGRYFPLSYSRNAVDKQTADVLELKP
jgi:penicillin amidase